MLAARLSEINSIGLVLASKSPRRSEILNNLGLQPVVCPSNFEETLEKKGITPAQYVEATSRGKGLEVYQLKYSEGFRGLVISADTVVVLDGMILEKPRDAEHAIEMLSQLSGSTHQVFTGVTILSALGTRKSLSCQLILTYVHIS